MKRRSEGSEVGELDRRDFLRLSAMSGAIALGSSCSPPGTTIPSEGETPALGAVGPAPELEEVSLLELKSQLETGESTARSLVERYLARIEALDRKGPALHAVIETNPDALKIADALDEERRQGQLRGPLHGVPILVKDNVATADLMTTTAGSLALAGSIPAEDAFVVGRLRAAGAILLGKANLSEWANFRSIHSTSGWSARGGQCRNPYALDRSPCGSSSGSGAAVAANLCAAAVGTETDGSVVCPSSANGIVGLKPTLGLVSRSGIIPIAHSQDTAGPMTRSVADAAVLLGAMIGVDPRDEATTESGGKGLEDYTVALDADGLAGKRIGVARQSFGFLPAVDGLMEDALEVMRDAGAVLVDPVEVAGLEELGGHEFEVLLYEFKHDLNRYLAALGTDAPLRTLEELIRFNEEHRSEEMPYFGQEILEQAQEKGDLSDPAYRKALSQCRLLSRQKGLDATFEAHGVDVVVAPTGSPAWTIDLVNGDHFLGGSSQLPAVSGYPNLTVPAGFVYGLPVGLSFIGRAWSEALLIEVAYAFEQATAHRRSPRFLPTADLST